jgi:hypothetical protein
MIVVGYVAPAVVEPALRIERVITRDAAGDERWWDPAELAAAHPEVWAAQGRSGHAPDRPS